MDRSQSLPVGVIVRRTPGVTRWAAEAFRVIAVVPGDRGRHAEGQGGWTKLREDGEVHDWHAGFLTLTLWRTDTDGYRIALTADPPSVWVILSRQGDGPGGLQLESITASAHEAQDFLDIGEDIVERVAMPDDLAAWVAAFVEAHPGTADFRKRKRGPRQDAPEETLGDARVRSATDIYRAPGRGE